MEACKEVFHTIYIVTFSSNFNCVVCFIVCLLELNHVAQSVSELTSAVRLSDITQSNNLTALQLRRQMDTIGMD